MKVHRKSSGNMLTLVVVTMGLIVAIGLIGLTFNGFLFQRHSTQYQVDALALSMASAMNAGNRIGQLNELEANSRELVYSARRRNADYQADDMSFLSSLSQQLLDEARAGQKLVEEERQNQIQIISTEVQQAAANYNKANNHNGTFSFHWLQTSEPKVTRVDVGQIVGVESNAQSLPVITELADFDGRQGYLAGQRRLFRANINASLPAEDRDLAYKFAALPAFVGKTCSPPRNANPDVFISYATLFENGSAKVSKVENIPYAVQIFTTMDVSVGANLGDRQPVVLSSVGTACGATSDSE